MADNGNPNVVVTFDQTPETRFYMCRSCKKSIVSSENVLFRGQESSIIVCQNAVNVKHEGVESVWICHHLGLAVMDVSCDRCKSALGEQIYRVIDRQVDPTVIQEGKFIFYLERMLFWNGDRMVYADTEQPIEDIAMADNNGNPNVLVSFDQNSGSPFYMCRSCRTGVFSLDDKFHKDQKASVIFCRNVANVTPEGVESVWPCHPLELVNLSCDQCNSVVGQKVHDIMVPVPASSLIQEGSFILQLGKMLLWNGSQEVYADTLQAVGDS